MSGGFGFLVSVREIFLDFVEFTVAVKQLLEVPGVFDIDLLFVDVDLTLPFPLPSPGVGIGCWAPI